MAFLETFTFPDAISRKLKVSRAFKTLITTGDNKWEQRLRRWTRSRIELSASLSIYDDSTQARILGIFEVAQGSYNGFRCRDWSDYFAGYAWNPTTRVWSVVTPEVIGTGNGSQTAFQLQKTYTFGGYTATRTVLKPRADTDRPLKMHLNGAVQSTGYTVNYATGVVTFTSAPGSGVVVAWAGLFDLPVRFADDTLSMNMEARNIGDSSIRLVELFNVS
jgi:uncharacterized protein (TIGR02217 family)